MTTTTYDDDISSASGDEIEIVAGRGDLPWTQVHDWVALSGVGNASIAAYLFLKMHLNRQTGLVNPGTVRLAALLGLPRADKVAAVIRPLVTIGAVEVKTYGMPRRNRYIVHSLPPADYDGPLSLGQWAKIHASQLDDERKKHAKKAENARNRRSGPVTPDSGLLETDQDDSPVTPNLGLQVTPDSGVHVAPDSGLEPDVGEPDVGEPDVVPPPPPSVGPDPTAVVDARDEEEEEEEMRPEQDADLTEAAREVLRRTTAGLSPARFPNRVQAGHLVALVAAALRSGWKADDLAHQLGEGDLAKANSIYAVIRHRIGALDVPPTRSVSDCHTMSPDPSWRDPRPPATDASADARVFARMVAKSRKRPERDQISRVDPTRTDEEHDPERLIDLVTSPA